jgi:hypothetical protein
MPVRIPPATDPVPLVTAGEALARGLLRDTTRRRSVRPPDWVLAPGAPTVLVEYGARELSELPRGARRVAIDESADLQLAVSGLRFNRMPVITWFLHTGIDAVEKVGPADDVEAGSRDMARQLRINLMRHHAEREALTYTLECLRDALITVHGPNLPHAELRSYLVRAAARLTRKERFGVTQAPIVAGIADIEAAAGFVDRADLSRYSESWEQLASVLDPDLFTSLFDALRRLPMGSPEETAGLRTVLRKGQRPPRKLAVSYSHKDDRLMRSFAAHLDEAVREGMIAPWDDRWIPAGAEWKPEIDRRFMEADIVVALVSEDFLASSYCMTEEMPRVQERVARGEAVLVPVVVRACEWQKTVLGRLQAVQLDPLPLVANGNRVAAWRSVVFRILRAQAGLR